MAKKGKPTWMTKAIRDEIRKTNARLKSIYHTFGYGQDYATELRSELSQYVPMTKSGAISTAAKGYDADTIDDTMQMIRDRVQKVSDIKSAARTRLSGVYQQRSSKYKKPVEEITEAAIVEQVNAEAFLESKTKSDFEQYYETWLKLTGSKIYDKALEEKLDELFRVGTKHIWSDAEYAEAFKDLQHFSQLAMEV